MASVCLLTTLRKWLAESNWARATRRHGCEGAESEAQRLDREVIDGVSTDGAELAVMTAMIRLLLQ